MLIAEVHLSQETGDFILRQADRKTTLGPKFEAKVVTVIPSILNTETNEVTNDKDSEAWKRCNHRKAVKGCLLILLVNGVAAVHYVGIRSANPLWLTQTNVMTFVSKKLQVGNNNVFARIIEPVVPKPKKRKKK